MIHYIGVFAVALIAVGAKATQQIQVQRGSYARILPVSLVLAAVEVFLITAVVREPSLATVLSLGLGGGLGCVLAMKFNHVKPEK